MSSDLTWHYIVKYLEAYYKKNNINYPRREAELLLSYVLDIKIVDGYLKNIKINSKLFSKIKKIAKKRVEKCVPLAYLLKRWHFFGYEFFVNENTLIPRPETEFLVEMILNDFDDTAINLLDIGTGSGNIAITVGIFRKNWKIIALDISKKAIYVARKNRKLHNVNNIKFFNDSIVSYKPEHVFDIIVSNPPYIKTSKLYTLDIEVKAEPVIALNGGDDGLFFYKTIYAFAKKFLRSNGILYLEIDHELSDDIKKIFSSFHFTECIKDYAGYFRYFKAVK